MINPLDLTGRSYLVTGASSGIGKETAVLLSRLGAKVVLVARSREGLEQTLALVEGNGHMIEPFDLAAYENIPNWLRNVAQSHGLLDGIVHSAGMHMALPLKAMEAQAVESLWKINVSAGLWLAKGFRHRSVNNAGGSLVFLASAAGLAGQAAHSAYSASKGALVAAAPASATASAEPIAQTPPQPAASSSAKSARALAVDMRKGGMRA